MVKAPFWTTPLSLVRSSAATTACRAFVIQICSLLFRGSTTSSSTTTTSRAHALQKSGRPLLDLTQAAPLSGRTLGATWNIAQHKRNIRISIFFIGVLVRGGTCEHSAKHSLPKNRSEGPSTWAVARRPPTSIAYSYVVDEVKGCIFPCFARCCVFRARQITADTAVKTKTKNESIVFKISPRYWYKPLNGL